MSSVTTLMITCAVLSDEDPEDLAFERSLLSWFDAPAPFAGRFGLRRFDHKFPGAKGAQRSVYAGVFNYFDLEGMIAHLESLPWESPECVQVFVNGEHHATFGVYEFRDGKLTLVHAAKED